MKSVIFTVYKELPEDSDGYKEIVDICINTHKKLAEHHGFDYIVHSDFDIPNYVKIKLDTIQEARFPNSKFMPFNSYTDLVRNKFTIDLHNTYDNVIYLDSDFLVASNDLLNNIPSSFGMANEHLLQLSIRSNHEPCIKQNKIELQNYFYISTKSSINIIKLIYMDQLVKIKELDYRVNSHTDLGINIIKNYKSQIIHLDNAGCITDSMLVYLYYISKKCLVSDLYNKVHHTTVDGYNLCLSALNKIVLGTNLTVDIYKNVINKVLSELN